MLEFALSDDLDALVASLAKEVAQRAALELELPQASPWLTKAEAIEYTRLARGTFEMYAAQGRFRGHGGKTKVFHRDELDQALKSL